MKKTFPLAIFAVGAVVAVTVAYFMKLPPSRFLQAGGGRDGMADDSVRVVPALPAIVGSALVASATVPPTAAQPVVTPPAIVLSAGKAVEPEGKRAFANDFFTTYRTIAYESKSDDDAQFSADSGDSFEVLEKRENCASVPEMPGDVTFTDTTLQPYGGMSLDCYKLRMGNKEGWMINFDKIRYPAKYVGGTKVAPEGPRAIAQEVFELSQTLSGDIDGETGALRSSSGVKVSINAGMLVEVLEKRKACVFFPPGLKGRNTSEGFFGDCYKIKKNNNLGWMMGSNLLEFVIPTPSERPDDLTWLFQRYGYGTWYYEEALNENSFTEAEYEKLITAAKDGNEAAQVALRQTLLKALDAKPADPKLLKYKEKVRFLTATPEAGTAQP